MFNMNRLSYKNPIMESGMDLSTSFSSIDSMNHSYFAEGCMFCSTMDNYMMVMERTLYSTICESSGSRVIVNEGFSDWFDSFKTLLKKVVDFLHALLNKFIVALNMFLKREAFIKNHKKDFSKFNDNHKFHMNVFTFTFDNEVPLANAIYTTSDIGKVFKNKYNGRDYNPFSGNYEVLKDDGYFTQSDDKDGAKTYRLDTSKDKGDTSYFTRVYNEFKRQIDDGEYYDKVRGEMLGYQEGTRIDASDYSKELFEKFRDGQSGKDEHEFEYSDIQDALLRFEAHDHVKKHMEKLKKDAEKEYKEVIKVLDHLVKKGKDGNIKISGGEIPGAPSDVEIDLGSDTAASKVNMLVKAMSNMVHEVSNIHTIGFTARLDAYKDCFKQDKSILYSALYRILGNIRTGERKYSTPKESD